MSENKLAPLQNLSQLHILQPRSLSKKCLLSFILKKKRQESFPVISLVETECQELQLSSRLGSTSCSPKMVWDSLLSGPVWPPVVRCTSWLDFTLQEPLRASKHPFLCFLCQNVCKIPTPTIDKTALTRCLKMAKGQWLSQRKSFV